MRFESDLSLPIANILSPHNIIGTILIQPDSTLFTSYLVLVDGE